MPSVEIGLVDYTNAQQSAILGLSDMFEIANGLNATDFTISVTRWTLAADGAFTRVSPQDSGGSPAVLLLPPGKGHPLSQDAAALYGEHLRSHHKNGTVLASVCAGSFILAESQLLDGRRATTHWAYEEEFRSRFPKVELDVSALLIDEVDIVTAGGMMAWTDLGLRLVERYLGSSAMLDTARTLLVDPPGREQRFYSSFVPALNHGDGAVLTAQHFIHAAYAKNITVAALAGEAGLGERTFLRRFRRATGKTSTDYIQHIRMNQARELLQFGMDSVDEIAWRCGYTDPGAFRKVFFHIVGLSPTDYRRRFQALRTVDNASGLETRSDT